MLHSYNTLTLHMTASAFGCKQLIHGFELDERTMKLMAEQGTYFTTTIGFLPAWWNLSADWTPGLFPGETVVEKGLARTYANLRKAYDIGITITIGSVPSALSPLRRHHR